MPQQGTTAQAPKVSPVGAAAACRRERMDREVEAKWLGAPKCKMQACPAGLRRRRPRRREDGGKLPPPRDFEKGAGEGGDRIGDAAEVVSTGVQARIARPAAERLSRRISEYLRERIKPSAPAFNAALTAA